VPERDLIREYLALIDPVVDELGSRRAINDIHKILETGTGADGSWSSLRRLAAI
jgi:carboxylate-amine ligase